VAHQLSGKHAMIFSLAHLISGGNPVLHLYLVRLLVRKVMQMKRRLNALPSFRLVV
jgi:hypothetical protein